MSAQMPPPRDSDTPTRDTPEPRFQRGDLVRRRSRSIEVGTIHDIATRLGGRLVYRVYVNGRLCRIEEDDLEAVGIEERDPRARFVAGDLGDRETAVIYLTYLRIHEGLSNYVYSFQTSRTRFYPHQFKPLIKFLDGSGRLLLADEVGLGKTIEAGLILLELKARRSLQRAVIVCPASLREKWRQEMVRRFDLAFDIVGARGLAARLDALHDDPTLGLFVITSYESARTARVRDRLGTVPLTLDILVCDEAHRLRTRSTFTFEMGAGLAAAATRVLLLTATPINNRAEDLFQQLSLLDPQLFKDAAFFEDLRATNERIVRVERLLTRTPTPAHDILGELAELEGSPLRELYTDNPDFSALRAMVERGLSTREDAVDAQRLANRVNFLSRFMTRTRRVEVEEERPVRRAHVHRIAPTAAERALYDSVFQLALRHYAEQRLPVMMLERVLASCMPAFLEGLGGGGRAWLGGEAQAGTDVPSPRSAEDAEATDEDADAEAEADAFATDDGLAQLPLVEDVRDTVARLGARAPAQGDDSKLTTLLGLIERLEAEEPGVKMIVFSYFRGTIAYLERELRRRGFGVTAIHGGIPTCPDDPARDERLQRLARFRDEPALRVLLSSEVGSEGLDLQFCHVVVHYDLPWNPMKVEQRIGRIDRIGQRAKALQIHSLVLEGTIDEIIHDRLLQKIGIFEDSIGHLETIVGGLVTDLREIVFSRELTPEEKRLAIERRADVLVRRIQDVDELDSGSTRIVGTDQYIRDEIERIRTGRRYVGPGEMETFVHAMFRLAALNLDLESDAVPGVFRARLSERVRAFFGAHLDDSSPANQFRGRLHRTALRWTFDPEVADDHADVELLNLHHAGVRALCSYLAREAAEEVLVPTFAAALTSPVADIAPESVLVVAVCLVEASGGVAPQKELVPFAIDLGSGSVLDRGASDRLLAAVLDGGRDAPLPDPWDRGVAEDVAQRLEDALEAYRRRKQEDLTNTERAYAAQRRQGIEAQYQRDLAAYQARLDGVRGRLTSAAGEQAARLAGLLKANEQQLANARAKRDELLQGLPASPVVTVETEIKCYGLVFA